MELLGKILGRAHRVDHLADGPERRGLDQLAPHEAAGGVFRVAQRLLDRGALHRVEGAEELALELPVQILDQIDDVVGVELLDRCGEILGRHRLEHVVSDAFLQLGQRVGIEIPAEHLDEAGALLGGDLLQKVRKVGFVKRFDLRHDGVAVPALQRVQNARHHVAVQREFQRTARGRVGDRICHRRTYEARMRGALRGDPDL